MKNNEIKKNIISWIILKGSNLKNKKFQLKNNMKKINNNYKNKNQNWYKNQIKLNFKR